MLRYGDGEDWKGVAFINGKLKEVHYEASQKLFDSEVNMDHFEVHSLFRSSNFLTISPIC